MCEIRLSAEQRAALQSEMKRNASVQVYRRAAALLAIDEGRPVSQVAALLGVTRQCIYNWVSTYGQARQGTDLSDAPRTGRPTVWTQECDNFLQHALGLPPSNFGYEASHWTAALLKQCLASRQCAEVSEETLRRQLRRLGYVWKRGRYTMRNGVKSGNGATVSLAPPGGLGGNVAEAGQSWNSAAPAASEAAKTQPA